MKILVTGASGQLGAYLLAELARIGQEVVGWSREAHQRRGECDLAPVDLADLDATEAALARADPGVVIHAAAITSAEAVRLDRPRAELINVRSTRRIAEWAESNRRRLVFTSTDLVFAGTQPFHREDDAAEPILAYGQTKRDAELAVLVGRGAVVGRLPLLFGPSRSGRASFFDRSIQALRRGEPQAFFEDEYRTPLDYRSAVRGLVKLALSDETGLIHLAGRERLSRFALMVAAAQALDLDQRLVRGNRQADATPAEPRPADVSLDTRRWQTLFPDETWPLPAEALRELYG